jgi:serine/threonine-protein kinase SRPK3
LARRSPQLPSGVWAGSDIWSLGTAIWEIIGMKFIFSESETQDETVAEQIDVLGYHNFPKAGEINGNGKGRKKTTRAV